MISFKTAVNIDILILSVYFLFFRQKTAATETSASEKIQSGYERNHEIATYNKFVDSTAAISTCYSRDTTTEWYRSSRPKFSNWRTSRKQWNVFGSDVFRRFAVHDPCQTCNLAHSWHTSVESIGWTTSHTLKPKEEGENESWRGELNQNKPNRMIISNIF